MSGRPAARLAGAGVRLGGRTVWSGVDLTIEAGEFVGILGPNGAGKSTLLKVLLALEPLSEGAITVLGDRPQDARAHTGYLPQRRTFDRSVRLRGIDLVRLGLDGARWGVPLPLPARLTGPARRRAAERVDEVIALVGAQAYAGRPIGELSGGEQQRLLIAQALVRRPDMLLLDEPLDSLDIANQTAIAALLAEICRTQGVTVLLVGHDVNPLVGYLDRVVYIAGGRAVSGGVRDVITTQVLSDLYGVPIEVLRAADGRLVVVGQPDGAFSHAHA